MWRFLTLDTETFVVDGCLNIYCISYTDGCNVRYFYLKENNDVFLEFLNSLGDKKYTFYVHNLTFDTVVLLSSINKHCVNITWFSKNYTIYWIKFQFKSILVEFRCSYKLLPFSLDYLSGKILNESKLVFPYSILCSGDFMKIGLWNPDIKNFKSKSDFDTFCNNVGFSNVDIKQYLIKQCNNDVRLLYKIIKIFMENIQILDKNLLKYSYSISSYSLNYYFKKYNLIQKKLPKNIDDLIRKSYFGGRCEVFGNAISNEYTLHFDFRGMYSMCMKELLPTKNFYYHEPGNFESPGFYNISFTSFMDIPVLPVKHDLLYFPNGTYTGTYWYEEILLFIECGGTINKINFAILCDVDFCMLDFATEMEKFRNNNSCANIIGKLITNTAYGRLGVNPIGFKDVISNNIDKNAYSYVKINDSYINKVLIKNNTISNVAVASAIASKARVKLYRAFEDVIKNKGRVLYCDTDSVFAAFDNLNVIGKKFSSGLFFDINNNNTIINKSWFANTKTYSIVYKNNVNITRIKGVSINSISYCDFKKFFLKKKILNIITENSFNKKNYSYEVGNFSKKIVLNCYKKRFFIKNYTKSIAINNIKFVYL